MNRDFPPLGVVFYSTFFTSIWMWIYAASIGLVKSTVYIDKFHFFAIKNLFRKEQPFMSLGAISITIDIFIGFSCLFDNHIRRLNLSGKDPVRTTELHLTVPIIF